MSLKPGLSPRQQQALLALHRGKAFGERESLSVRSLVERRELPDSRYAGPLAGLEEAGLVASHREFVRTSWRSSRSWWLTDEGRNAGRELGDSRFGRATARATVRVLEADEALGAGLDPERLSQARERVVAETLALEPGPWTPEVSEEGWRQGLGLLVLEGLLVREVRVKRKISVELLGPGDLLRPWTYHPEHLSAVPVLASWEVLTGARLAVLDRQFSVRLAFWPEVTAVLLDRAVLRSRSLAIQSAVRHGGQIEDRLLLTLWHLAHRWGELEEDGVALRLEQLTPAVLARMAATTPGSAAGALDRLEEQGVTKPLHGGGWRLSKRQQEATGAG
jgi:CRP/FNR family transcriptional regulator, cyclic AMP receptor protein